MSGTCLHGNDAVAAVAQAIVLIHSLSVLIYCENESENGRLRKRVNNYVSLLSRLPHLRLKRGSQSTCLLIHLKLSSKRTPQCLSLPLLLFVLPLFPHFFHIKLLFIALFPNMCFFFSLCFCVCTNLSALPLYVFRLQPRLTSQLYVGLAESPPPLLHHYPSPSSNFCCRARGEEKLRD